MSQIICCELKDYDSCQFEGTAWRKGGGRQTDIHRGRLTDRVRRERQTNRANVLREMLTKEMKVG